MIKYRIPKCKFIKQSHRALSRFINIDLYRLRINIFRSSSVLAIEGGFRRRGARIPASPLLRRHRNRVAAGRSRILRRRRRRIEARIYGRVGRLDAGASAAVAPMTPFEALLLRYSSVQPNVNMTNTWVPYSRFGRVVAFDKVRKVLQRVHSWSTPNINFDYDNGRV